MNTRNRDARRLFTLPVPLTVIGGNAAVALRRGGHKLVRPLVRAPSNNATGAPSAVAPVQPAAAAAQGQAPARQPQQAQQGGRVNASGRPTATATGAAPGAGEAPQRAPAATAGAAQPRPQAPAGNAAAGAAPVSPVKVRAATFLLSPVLPNRATDEFVVTLSVLRCRRWGCRAPPCRRP